MHPASVSAGWAWDITHLRVTRTRTTPPVRFTRIPGQAYSQASGRATSPPLGPWFAHFDQMTVGIANVAALLVRVLFRRRQELSTPGAPFGVHGIDVLTRLLRKLLTRSGSRGVSRMTVGFGGSPSGTSTGWSPPPKLACSPCAAH